MGAKLSKKKKSYCLGAGKDGESTETTEVEQKPSEISSEQKEATELGEEKALPIKIESNGKSEDLNVQTEKSDIGAKPDGTSTKDDQNQDQIPEDTDVANTPKAEETSQHKEESKCSSTIQDQSVERTKEDKCEKTQQKTQPQESEKSVAMEKKNNLDSSSDPPCASVTEPHSDKERVAVLQQEDSQDKDVKEAVQELSDASKAEKDSQQVTVTVHEEASPIPEEKVIPEPGKNENATAPVTTPESSTMEIVRDMIETVKSVEASVEFPKGQEKDSQIATSKYDQTTPPLIATVKPQQVSVEVLAETLVPSIEPIITEKAESLVESQTHKSVAEESAVVTDCFNSEKVLEQEKLVVETVISDVAKEMLDVEPPCETPLEPDLISEKMCEETKGEPHEDEQHLPKTTEVPEQSFTVENEQCGNQEMEIVCSKSASESISHDQSPTMKTPEQEPCKEAPITKSHSTEVKPLQNDPQDNPEEPLISQDLNMPDKNLEEQNAPTNDGHSSEKHLIENKKSMEEDKPILDVVQETLNHDPIQTAADLVPGSDFVEEVNNATLPSEDNLQNLDEKTSPENVQIKEKPVTLNGLPNKEESKIIENLENGSNHQMNDLNGQSENHEIAVCSE
ncbi:hypothetical protein GDO86_008352 [Hymenochirus boettgeri]|uniref:Uncharacterized protein n=1 Tax=Hymenochirus boettgeri TaxID=247094 RepID=A0A8T2J5C4_9PIPI|nr:hypothetical protein GDO86_008352 [Hymenochirus boettgeri]